MTISTQQDNNQGDLGRYHNKLRSLSNNTEQTKNYNIYAFYKFVKNPISEAELQPLRDLIYNKFQELDIKGTIYIGTEGINGTVCDAGRDSVEDKNNLKEAFEFVQAQPQIGKYSHAEFNPFKKLKVKARPEIVTLGAGKIDSLGNTGVHVNAKEWNELLKDPECIVIDNRNDFECKMGTFENAVDPDTKTFRDFPEYIEKNLDKNKHKKVAMCCTGGVRCEKSTAYLKELGFENVYQLEGGILKYFEEIEPEESMWQGRCFIFDDRIAVDQEVKPVGVPEDYVNYGRRDLMPQDDEY